MALFLRGRHHLLYLLELLFFAWLLLVGFAPQLLSASAQMQVMLRVRLTLPSHAV